ncbi:MAG: uroporphyrinogen-III C-methyltransferase [Rhodospirillales bacterium]|nr:uroporphyrinogen-III C-methyltransferase [Rhodospirillales bacterium]
MQAFPVFLSLQGRRALIVGGGDAAARKAELLLKAGAQVSLVASTVGGEIAQLIAEGHISWAGCTFDDSELDGMSLVIVAIEDEPEQARVSDAAQKRCLPVNVVDRPALSSFIMPAIIDRAPITIAISTAGTAPVLAQRIRAEIERTLPAALGRLARFADVFREQVRRTLVGPRARRRFWDRVFEGRVGELALAGDEISARRELIRLLDGFRNETPSAGMVHLVGAGPGDPDLLTLKAHRLLQRADVVVCDRLVPDEILSMARRDAERVYVGERRANHCVPQKEINERMVALARAGKSVVRLKGGDPFVFGRGGEEVEVLVKAGVAVEVVPGVTAALGCASSAGIPLTHRDHAQACVLVTGHLEDGKLDLDWKMLSRPRQTVVIYMELDALPQIASQLVAHGLPASTPVALIENGTTERERRVVGTLATIEQQARRTFLSGPTLCMVGEVVGLALSRDRELNFESRMGL